jgi:hypothetical protein
MRTLSPAVPTVRVGAIGEALMRIEVRFDAMSAREGSNGVAQHFRLR